mmetsp:Transcript_24940/g.46544  ORF Transcript_24940/g.46544 Transcript_24940/m.46544 type:complete len:366 (-) Transcript_24940:135-1232(-)
MNTCIDSKPAAPFKEPTSHPLEEVADDTTTDAVVSATKSAASESRRGYQKWTQKLADGKFKRVLAKLFTNEDHIQVHKTLGILSVVSFLYRYFYVYPTTGTLGFDGRMIDHLSMAVHILLSTSSLIFHVLSHRLIKRPMIIWEEYRLHAICFSVRCMSVYLFATFKVFEGTMLERIALPALVLAHHVMADKITEWYGSKDGTTTVRVKDNQDRTVSAILRFYAFYQFTALASHLQPNARLADLGFNALIAIQSSAFLMTLYRKGLITDKTHGFFYTSCLIISTFHIFANCFTNFLFLGKLACCFVLRTKFRMNKYVMWTGFVLACMPQVENALLANFAQFVAQSQLNWERSAIREALFSSAISEL